MFDKILIANRGEIACRVIRTCRRLGISPIAVYSQADATAQHVRLADAAYPIGGPRPADSYLRSDAIIEAALKSGAQAIHPGYGFLSENPGFADACAAAGIVFIGPTGDQMRMFGLKHAARALAKQHGVPLLPGSGLLRDEAQAEAEAKRLGYPVMLKSTAGGGGIGMALIRQPEELAPAFAALTRHGLVFDALVKPPQIPALLALLDRETDLPVVVDHGAKPDLTGADLADLRDGIAALAARPNTACKLSGLVTEAGPDWNDATLAPVFAHLLACFGPQRLLWGSDWPVVTLRAPYGD